MRQLDMSAKRGILQELLNNHSFRSQDFDRCYEASLLHDGGRMGLYGESVFTGRTYSERVKPFVSLIAAHYGHDTPDAFFATGLESQDPDIRRRATYVILEGTPSSSKTALQARVLFTAFLSGGNLPSLKGGLPTKLGSFLGWTPSTFFDQTIIPVEAYEQTYRSSVSLIPLAESTAIPFSVLNQPNLVQRYVNHSVHQSVTDTSLVHRAPTAADRSTVYPLEDDEPSVLNDNFAMSTILTVGGASQHASVFAVDRSGAVARQSVSPDYAVPSHGFSYSAAASNTSFPLVVGALPESRSLSMAQADELKVYVDEIAESQTKDLESLWGRLEEVYAQVGSQTEAVKLALKEKLGKEIVTLQQELRTLKSQGSVRDALRMIAEVDAAIRSHMELAGTNTDATIKDLAAQCAAACDVAHQVDSRLVQFRSDFIGLQERLRGEFARIERAIDKAQDVASGKRVKTSLAALQSRVDQIAARLAAGEDSAATDLQRTVEDTRQLTLEVQDLRRLADRAEESRREVDSLKVALDARVRELADRAADRQREVEALSANQRKMEGQISSMEDIIRLVARQNQDIKEMLAEERRARTATAPAPLPAPRRLDATAPAPPPAPLPAPRQLDDTMEGSGEEESDCEEEPISALPTTIPRRNNVEHMQPTATADAIPRRTNVEYMRASAAATAAPGREEGINGEKGENGAIAEQLSKISGLLGFFAAGTQHWAQHAPRPALNGIAQDMTGSLGDRRHGHAAAAANLLLDATRSGRDIFARRKVGSVLPPVQTTMNPFQSETWLLCRPDRPIVKRLPDIIEVIQDVCTLPKNASATQKAEYQKLLGLIEANAKEFLRLVARNAAAGVATVADHTLDALVQKLYFCSCGSGLNSYVDKIEELSTVRQYIDEDSSDALNLVEMMQTDAWYRSLQKKLATQGEGASKEDGGKATESKAKKDKKKGNAEGRH